MRLRDLYAIGKDGMQLVNHAATRGSRRHFALPPADLVVKTLGLTALFAGFAKAFEVLAA
jgi:hypothetical protein